jgi:hypothetical protein
VREREAPGPPGCLRDEPGGHRGLQRVQHVAASDPLDGREVELRALHGGDGQRGGHVGSEAIHALGDELAHAGGHLAGVRVCACELLEQQRVAACAVGDRGGPTARTHGIGELRRLVGPETAEL